MRAEDAIIDSIGLSIMAVAVTLPMSCVPAVPAAAARNLQPLVAVAGAYGAMEANVSPAPAPPPPTTSCDPACRCNGTGKEKTGDGLSVVACRCPDSCRCKQPQKAVVPTQGVPGWPPKNLRH